MNECTEATYSYLCDLVSVFTQVHNNGDKLVLVFPSILYLFIVQLGPKPSQNPSLKVWTKVEH